MPGTRTFGISSHLYHNYRLSREHLLEVAALRLGSFGLALLPGEVFVELGREVEEASPLKPTRTIGLTNGALGYIPTRRAYAKAGFDHEIPSVWMCRKL